MNGCYGNSAKYIVKIVKEYVHKSNGKILLILIHKKKPKDRTRTKDDGHKTKNQAN